MTLMKQGGIFMKKIKNYLLFLIVLCICPIVVQAGTIRFNTPVKTSENTYEFTLTVDNIKLNAISGNISITNGTITNIIMSSSWINQTGNSGNFYFYRNGGQTGSYTVATIQVTMTGNSEYKIENWEYNLNKCKMDKYNHYFGEDGTLVSKETYDKTCSISKDASLKTLKPSQGTLSPTFNSSLELYSMTVGNSTSSISFSTTTNSSKAKVISGNTCSLKVGLNLCKITVRAEAGNEKTYTITVTRKNTSGGTASNDASIKNLQVHGATLTKTFNSQTTEYDLKPDKNANSIYFTFTMNSNNQTYTSQSCGLTSATKTCKLTVTAEDGVTKKSYVFNILQDSTTSTNNTTNNTTGSTSTSSSTNKNTSTNTSQKGSTTGTTSSKTDNSEVDIEEVGIDSNPNQNTDGNEDENKNIEEENQDATNKNEEETANKIKLPIVNKEIEKNIFFIVIAVVDLCIGILIGVLITKHYKKTKNK